MSVWSRSWAETAEMAWEAGCPAGVCEAGVRAAAGTGIPGRCSAPSAFVQG